MIAFVEDPTGYKWELITRKEPIPEPIAQVYYISILHAQYCIPDQSFLTLNQDGFCMLMMSSHSWQGALHPIYYLSVLYVNVSFT